MYLFFTTKCSFFLVRHILSELTTVDVRDTYISLTFTVSDLGIAFAHYDRLSKRLGPLATFVVRPDRALPGEARAHTLQQTQGYLKDALLTVAQHITLAGQALTTQIEQQATQIERQAAEIKELKRQLNRDSSNSNKPPSSDPPYRSPRKKPRTGKRKPGGQPGHEGKTRALLPPEQVGIGNGIN